MTNDIEHNRRTSNYLHGLEQGRREAADHYAALADAVRDTCWKATIAGNDGDRVTTYLLPAGTMHRLIGAAQGAGIPAAFRSVNEQELILDRSDEQS